MAVVVIVACNFEVLVLNNIFSTREQNCIFEHLKGQTPWQMFLLY